MILLADSIVKDERNYINVTGVPGAGKTSLAVKIAGMYQPSEVLYLSFGRENTLKVRRRLKDKATCTSFHAFSKKMMNIDGNRIVSRINLSLINQATKNTEYALQSAKELECIMLMIDEFCKNNMSLSNSRNMMLQQDKYPNLNDMEKYRVQRSFNGYWESLWKPSSTLPITHDMYLKQLSLQKINVPFKLVLVDEAQDLNDAMHALVMSIYLNNNVIKVVNFGDPCQQIFSFRGSSRRFLEAEYHYKLDTTHRFGDQISNLCNQLMLKQGIPYYTNINSNEVGGVISETPDFECIAKNIKSGIRPVLISRFNYTLWQALKEFSERGIKCSLLGGISSDELGFLKALNQLYNGNRSRHPGLNGMTYVDYKRMARSSNDKGAILACRFVESVGDDASLFDKIKKSIVNLDKAEVLLTTAHQAKGLEFNNAFLLDDFPDMYCKDKKMTVKIKDEEVHLMYTAISRAKRSIGLPSAMYEFYQREVKK